MRLTIKTLDQRTFHVDFDETLSVWDLKAHLHKLPEIGVKPELQQLIYAGRVLENESLLNSYAIDERKFLVVMTKKAPDSAAAASAPSASAGATPKKEEEKPAVQEVKAPKEPEKTKTPSPPPVATATTTSPAPAAASSLVELLTSPELAPTGDANEEMVQNIVCMGYPESEVRRALAASFNNPDRAIEYLIEGIPDLPGDMLGEEQALPAQVDPANPLAFLRTDPRFNQLRSVIQQRPEMLGAVLARIGETNPGLLTIIREHQDEFVRMINENTEEGADVNPNAPNAAAAAAGGGGAGQQNVIQITLTEEERLAVERLTALGFPQELVIQAYIACDKNEEQTADFLFRHVED